jgi:hypothetical protein
MTVLIYLYNKSESVLPSAGWAYRETISSVTVLYQLQSKQINDNSRKLFY